MAHDSDNPRTKKYSSIKTFFIFIEALVKKSYLLIFLILNFFFHSKKEKNIDISNYKDLDSRFINYFFKSLNNTYNFTYNFSFSVIDFMKKIGVKNFMIHCTPNFFVKKKNKIRFLLNNKNTSSNEINFNTNYFSNNKNANKLFLPYYIYPRLYNKNYDGLEKYKFNKKKIKIFFSGSTNKEVYGKFSWTNEDNSKLLNRVEIIDFIIKNYENKIFYLKKYDDLKDIDYLNKPIVLSINDKLIKKTKTNLTHNQHLEIISKSNFILTAPGADMPLCHHLIEGIKMNAIPISNYAQLHQPKIDKNDYLYFDDYDTLQHSINTALNMKDEEINKIQKRLEIFYKNSLSPESFAKKFENRNDNEVIACNDVESLRWL